jgi:hypothetical protein
VQLNVSPASLVKFRTKNDRKLLISEDDSDPLPVQQKSLEHVLTNDLRPGTILLRNPENPHLYELRKFDPTIIDRPSLNLIKRSKKTSVRARETQDLKTTLLFLNSTPLFVIEQLAKLYKFMKHGFTVEIHVHRTSKKREGRGKDAFQDMLKECLHYRPDVILRSMPPGTGIVVDVKTNWVQYCWVIGRGKEGEAPLNLTKGLENRRATQFELNIDPQRDQHMLGNINVTGNGRVNPSSSDLRHYRKYKSAGGNEEANKTTAEALRALNRKPRSLAQKKERARKKKVKEKIKLEKKRALVRKGKARGLKHLLRTHDSSKGPTIRRM